MTKWRNIFCAAAWGVLLVSFGFLLVHYRAWLSPEERVLEEVFGVYAREEMLHANDAVYPYSPRKYEAIEPDIWLKREYYGTGEDSSIEQTGFYSVRKNPKYIVKKIDPEFMANGVVDQGKALHFELIRNLDMLEQYRQRYAILISNPEGDYANPGRLSSYETFFYLDGVLYESNVCVTRLRRMEDCPPPIEAEEQLLPDPRLEKLMGDYFCTFFDVGLWGNGRSTTFQDIQLSGTGPVTQSSFQLKLSPGQVLWRKKSPYYPDHGFDRYEFVNRPSYQILGIDADFLNNDVREQGAALRRLISNEATLDSYQEKYALIIPTGNTTNLTVFYLDGEIYSTMGYGNLPLLHFYRGSEVLL